MAGEQPPTDQGQTSAADDAVATMGPGEVEVQPDSPLTGSAVWRNKDVDQPVTVMGDGGEKDGREYLLVENPDSPAGYIGVPKDEITFVEPGSSSDETSQEGAEKERQEAEEQARIERLVEIGATVESKDTSSGGHTIPGTNEWIPDTKGTKHTLVTPDLVSGEVERKEVDADFADRFNQYKETSREQRPDEQANADAAAESSVESSQVGSGNSENNSEADVNSISDLVQIDTKGRGHYSGSKKLEGIDQVGRNGKFMSNEEMEVVAANQDLIRNNLPPGNENNRNASDGGETSEVEVSGGGDDHGPGSGSEAGSGDGGEGTGGNGINPPGEPEGDPDHDRTPPDGEGAGGDGEGENAENGDSSSNDDGGESNNDTAEVPPVVQELAPEIVAREQANEALQHAIDQHAHAKIRLERIIAGADAQELFRTSETQLTEATNAFIEANAAMMQAQDQELDRAVQANQAEMEEATNRLRELSRQRLQAQAEGTYDDSLDDEITRIMDSIVDHQIYSNLFEENRNNRQDRRQTEADTFNLEVITDIQCRVDRAMIEERTRRHPRLAKVGEWLKQHPKTRLAVGLGLTAMGIVGAATFNAPLIGIATAGGAALRGYGSYNFARGIGDMIASRRMNKAEIQTVEDYLMASRQESDTRRRSKRVGATVAAALIAAPLVGKMIDVFHHPGTAGPKPPTAPPPTAPAAPPPTITVTPTGGNMLPWTFGEQVLHTNISDPNVLGQLVHNAQGISFQGNGLGGGLGAINSVTIPGQGTFTDLGHINGAIAAILGNAA